LLLVQLELKVRIDILKYMCSFPDLEKMDFQEPKIYKEVFLSNYQQKQM